MPECDDPELCDQRCGSLDCHTYGCVILNSENPNKQELKVLEDGQQTTAAENMLPPIMLC